MTTEASPLPPDALPAGEEIQREHRLDLEPLPGNVSVARRFIKDNMPVLDDQTAETIVLLTSELVTNAVIHARTPLTVGLSVTTHFVVVTVYDLDLGHGEVNPAGRDGGRGLKLVDGLADKAGMYVHVDGGKTAWFRLPRQGRPGQEELLGLEASEGVDL